jgi:pimeloyl-ACP methyl ester carboxylesterase
MSTMTQQQTRFATSEDGTTIAYDVTGTGPALVIVEGAMCQRSMGTAQVLRDSLAADYSVVAYDRRGRGESGAGASPYEVQREVEDLVAVIEAAGGDCFVLGTSSGAALTLEAARQGVPMRALAAYEAPFIVDGTHAPNDPDLGARTQAFVDAGKRGEAVKLFMKTVGAPAAMVAVMPLFPVWKKLTAVAHTLPHDYAIVLPFEQGEPLPAGHYASIAVPVIVIAGGRSPEYMRNAQAAIAEQLPHGRLVTLKGQTHMVKAKATTPALKAFFV